MKRLLSSGRSYLLVAPEPLTGEEFEQAELVDQILLNAEEANVKELRQAIAQAAEKPYGELRLFIINNAHELSDVMQNTLLKTLEEPSAALAVVLQARSAENFLPTVRSRLHTLSGGSTALESLPAFGDDRSLENQLTGIKDRQSLIALLRQELQFRFGKVFEEPTYPHQVSLLEKAILKLERNCNQKLVIDWLLLHWFANQGNN